ncbi:nucleotidyltransferase domain-containing protein [Candidatus Woesearchaeota archaeon]|nr:nucleotidyltransferase domain-containing protein [Candidatus Woesearchaeota archaeon]
MLRKSHRILYLFAKEPCKSFTFKEVKLLTKSKSESYVYNTIKNFVKEGVLIQKKVGNVVVYEIKWCEKAVFHLSNVVEYISWNRKNIPYENLEEIMSKIPTYLFSFIITGSYANEKQKKESDIDIVILCSIAPNKVYAEIKHFCELNIPKIHLYVFKEEEFLQMLLDKKPNYGKEIVKNNLILTGAEAYYKILMEAIKNGFSG